MTARLIFLTHAEVVIDPDVPVPKWPLNDKGRARHAAFADHPVLSNVTALFASDEQKAVDAALITAPRIGMEPRYRSDLGENDRSATGYLPGPEFEAAADAFFAEPTVSFKGWERAIDVQARIVAAVSAVLTEPRAPGDVLVISHGAVGALLRCHLKGIQITREEDQTAGGGCWFMAPANLDTAPTDWTAI
ncbi:MAG: histidine phosphatase family protein [Pseudomonadota bacterium]